LGLLSQDSWLLRDGLSDPGRRLRNLLPDQELTLPLRPERAERVFEEEPDQLWHGTTCRGLDGRLARRRRTGHGFVATAGAGNVTGLYSSDIRKCADRYPMVTWEGNQHHGEIVTSDQMSPLLVMIELHAMKKEKLWSKTVGTNRQWAHNPEDVTIVSITFRGMATAQTGSD
jgi:hypothetical protein